MNQGLTLSAVWQRSMAPLRAVIDEALLGWAPSETCDICGAASSGYVDTPASDGRPIRLTVCADCQTDLGAP